MSNPAFPDTGKTKHTRFPLYTPDEFTSLPPQQWRVQGVMPTTGLGAVYGPSGSGKSFIVLDMVAKIAEGDDWHSHPTKSCRILCVVLEGATGYAQRIKAWEHHNGRKYPADVCLMKEPFDLASEDDVDALISVLRSAGGFEMVVIDTLNRAAVGVDENSSRDMAKIVVNATKLQKKIGGLVVLVHHTGKDASRGMRGHSSLHAAMDAIIETTRNGDDRACRVAKLKDGADGEVVAFTLEPVEFVDDAGELRSSCVVVPTQGGSNAFERGGAATRMSPNQQAVMASFNLMMVQAETSIAVDEDEAAGDADVSILAEDLLSQVRDEVSGGSKHGRQRAKEALEALISAGRIERDGDRLRRVSRD